MWLHQECDGNIDVAYEIWKRCLKNLDNDVLMIDYGSKNEILEVLPDETLLVLRQILRFSTVRIQDLEYWYGCSTVETQIIITELLNNELLEMVPSKSNYYRIPLHKQPLLFERLRTHGWGV